MKLVYKYCLEQLTQTLLPLFATLFFIVSIIFFIQLAKITAYVEISFLELFKLYIFLLPKLILLTLPLSFFISLCLCLYRLCKESELLALFALGFSPTSFLRFFLKIAGLGSALMLIIALVFIPVSFELFDNFINYKKFSAKLNLKTSEFGQRYLRWMIFVEKKSKNDTYENITMYHPKIKPSDKEQLIIAKKGELIREPSSVSFKLSHGTAYNLNKNKWDILDFKELLIRTKFKNYNLNIRSFYHYFDDIFVKKEKAKEFIMYVLIALFPLACTPFALVFGIVTYRYHSGYVYPGMFGVIFLYFGSLLVFSSKPFLAISLVFLTFFASSLILYFATTARKY